MFCGLSADCRIAADRLRWPADPLEAAVARRWTGVGVMASVTRRPDGRYRARYRDLAGKEHARHFDRKVDAQLWLDGITTSVHTGTYVDPKRMRLTVGEWAAQWLATRIDVKPTTFRGYESA